MRTPAGSPGSIWSIRALTASITCCVLAPDARDDDAADRLVRALDERRHAERVADPDVRDLPNEHGHAVRARITMRSRSSRDWTQADAAHDRPGAVGFDDVAADVGVALEHGATTSPSDRP